MNPGGFVLSKIPDYEDGVNTRNIVYGDIF